MTKTDTQSNQLCPEFIDTNPLGQNLFVGNAHAETAQRIAEVIQSNQSQNKLLGIDGAWGSGKSNLIKMIETTLKDTHHFFYYDAWGHQEDLHRRSFLQELTESLHKKGIIERELWGKKLKELLARKREKNTKTIPRVSQGILWTALIVVLTPIAQTIGTATNSVCANIVLTSTPLILGMIAYAFYSFKAKRLLTLSDGYRLYKDHELSQETHVTISESEPSVRQFQNWMRELSCALKGKSLVVVFDNMDRLPKHRVKELWSSIHTFFAEKSYEKVWVLVPFDRNHLLKTAKDSVDIDKEFLRKSFSIIYRVAPPVLTDWHTFFDSMYMEVFGSSDEVEQQAVRRIFSTISDEITPRRIISFINDMVATRHVMRSTIDLRYIALFELKKESLLESPVDQIVKREYLEDVQSIFAGDETVDDNVAALVYNVSPDRASQVTLAREIEQALETSDSERLNFLANHTHFIEILVYVVGAYKFDYESVVLTISNLKIFRDPSRPQSVHVSVWDILCEKILTTYEGTQSVSDAAQILLTECSSSLRKRLVNNLVAGIQYPQNDFEGSLYFTALDRLSKVLDETDLDLELDAMLTSIPVEPNVYVDYLTAAKENYSRYPLICDETELCNHVIACIPNELIDFSSLVHVKEAYDFSPVIEELQQHVDSESLNSQNIGMFYLLYRSITKEKPIQSLNGEHLERILMEMEEDSDGLLDLLAMRVALGIQYEGSGYADDEILSDVAPTTVESISELIEYYEDYGELLLAYLEWPQPILKEVLVQLTKDDNEDSALDIVDVLPRYQEIQSSLELEPEIFLQNLNGWTRYAKEEVTIDNLDEVIVDVEFYQHAVEVDCELTDHILTLQCDVLERLSQSEWEEAFNAENSLRFKVTHILLESRTLKKLPEYAVAVYKNVLMSSARGERELLDRDVWETFYKRTHKSSLRATAKNIRDLYCTTHQITPDKFLEFYDLLVGQGSLKQRSDDVTRRILAHVIHDADCRALICSNSDTFIPIVRAAGNDASDLKDVIAQLIVETDESEDLLKFARAIKVENIDE